jgi:hypothetical protein
VCLRGMKLMCLTLENDGLWTIEWWVDASFAVHEDMRGHAGGAMTLGKGSVHSSPVQQKLNTKSSTEEELVGVDDMMPMVLWTRQFREGQGCDIEELCIRTTGVQSCWRTTASSLAPNQPGIWTSGCFFVTDRIKAKQLTMEHCPTGDMRAHPFTEPLQRKVP